MSVTAREESSKPVSRNFSQLHDQGQLHTAPLVIEHHLIIEKKSLEKFKFVLRTHDRLFPFLCAQTIFDGELLPHLRPVSEKRVGMTPTYPMHLALHERINHLASHLFLPHQVKHVLVCLQGAGRTQGILSNGEKLTEETGEDVDLNAFEGD